MALSKDVTTCQFLSSCLEYLGDIYVLNQTSLEIGLTLFIPGGGGGGVVRDTETIQRIFFSGYVFQSVQEIKLFLRLYKASAKINVYWLSREASLKLELLK